MTGSGEIVINGFLRVQGRKSWCLPRRRCLVKGKRIKLGVPRVVSSVLLHGWRYALQVLVSTAQSSKVAGAQANRNF